MRRYIVILALCSGAFVLAACIVLVFAVEYVAGRTDLLAAVMRRPLAFRWAVYLAVLLVIVVFGYYGPVATAADFAYFKF